MRDILFILISIFVSGNILTQWHNRKMLPWMNNPMSAYLAGVPWAWVQDIGFAALAVTLGILGYQTLILASAVAFFCAGIALVLVIITKYVMISPTLNAATHTDVLDMHRYAAGIAFLGAPIGVLFSTWHTRGLANGAALAAFCVAYLFMRFAPKKTELEERAVAACIVIALYALGAAL